MIKLFLEIVLLISFGDRAIFDTALDYILRDYVGSVVYVDKTERKDGTRNVLLKKMVENSSGRMRFLRATRDGHMSALV